MNVVRAGGKMFSAKILATLLSFGALAYFTRVLTPAQIGVFFLFQGIVRMSLVVADVGIGTAIEKVMSEGRGRSDAFTTGLALKLGTAAVTCTGVMLARPFLADYIGRDLSYLLVIAIFVEQLSGFVSTALRGERRVGETAELTLVKILTYVGIAVILLQYGFDERALIAGFVGGGVISLLWGWVKLDTGLSMPTLERARSLLGFAKYNVIPSIGLQVHNWMDVLIIGWFLHTTAVGSYEVTWRLAGVTMLLASAVSTTVIPEVSASHADGNLERVEHLVTHLLVPSLVLIIPAFFGVSILGPQLLTVLFGSEYAGASLVLVVLVAGKLAGAVQTIVGKALLGLDRPDLVARATVIGIAGNLGLNLLLVWQFGLIGAAIGTTTAFTLGMAVRVHYFRRHLAFRVPWRRLGWMVISAVGMATVLTWMLPRMAVSTIPEAIAIVALGGGVYFVFLALYPPLRKDGIRYLDEFHPATA